MKLMTDEKILLESNDNELILTTHRVRLTSESFGLARIVSIMLDELASCAITRISHPIFLVLASICFIGGALIAVNGRGDSAMIGGIVLAVILVVVYLLNRPQVLALASAGATIQVNTQGMKLDEVKAFIDRAEMAKNARYLMR